MLMFGNYKVLGRLIGANMNITTDQQIFLQGTNVLVCDIVVTNASTSLTTAAGGFYSAAAKGGTAIVAAGQAYANLTVAARALKMTIAQAFQVLGSAAALGSIFFNLTTGQGGAATADIYVLGVDLTV